MKPRRASEPPGFPALPSAPWKSPTRDSHIPTAPTTTLFLGDISIELTMGTLLSSLDISVQIDCKSAPLGLPLTTAPVVAGGGHGIELELGFFSIASADLAAPFPALPKLDQKLVLELARCQLIDRREMYALSNSEPEAFCSTSLCLVNSAFADRPLSCGTLILFLTLSTACSTVSDSEPTPNLPGCAGRHLARRKHYVR